jgi:hypothetical protein
METAAFLAELPQHPGLCATCVHLRLLRSPRSTFARCGKADVDPSFPRYPRLPVVACGGHRPTARADAPPPPTLLSDVEGGHQAMLHVTNGDSVVAGFREAALAGDYLPWRDALHDGPVPMTATLEELSEVRARALAAFGWGAYAGLRAAFARRDAVLGRSGERDEVVLWFEHDLYDQLQLLQVLDWFAQQGTGGARLSLVQVDSFPGVVPFHGLGQLRGAQLLELLPRRQPVTMRQLAAGAAAWRDFRAGDPRALAGRAATADATGAGGRASGDDGLPFLAAALRRFCEEYPSTRDGLARGERQVLAAVASGARRATEIYLKSRDAERCPWGDASVFLRLEGLASAAVPALERDDRGDYTLTPLGKRLLSGGADWVRDGGGVDRWLGGVHLQGTAVPWRWDEDGATIVGARG